MIIKICGITSTEAAQAAKEQGADLIGFVFTDSRRKIDVPIAEKISALLSGVGKVGVFLNQPLREVQEIAQRCRLDYVQLHGEESPEYCRAVNRPVIKAFRVGSGFSSEMAAAYTTTWILLDSFVQGQPGGTGVNFDWESARKSTVHLQQKFIVAGGLTPENVASSIRVLRPDGVDVSGGVETAGVKDPDKIRRFIEAARMTAERSPSC